MRCIDVDTTFSQCFVPAGTDPDNTIMLVIIWLFYIRFNLSFFVIINFISVSDLTCFFTKSSAIKFGGSQVLRHLEINLVKLIFVWCFNSLEFSNKCYINTPSFSLLVKLLLLKAYLLSALASVKKLARSRNFILVPLVLCLLLL